MQDVNIKLSDMSDDEDDHSASSNMNKSYSNLSNMSEMIAATNNQGPKKSKKLILIVDDSEYNIMALKTVLLYKCRIDPQKQCDSADDGQSAIDLVIANIAKN